MKHKILVAAILVLHISCANKKTEQLNTPQEVRSASILTVQNVDFGTVNQGDMVLLKSVVANQGEDTIKIEEVSTPCTCTVAEHPAFISPNSTDTIVFRLNTKNKMGVFESDVVVKTNTKQKFHKIKLTGKID